MATHVFSRLPTLALFLLIIGVSSVTGLSANAAEEAPEAQTTAKSEITLEQLPLLLRPLPRDQLLVEADGWRALLQDKAQEIAELEVEISQVTAEATRAEATRDLAGQLQTQLEEVATLTQSASSGAEGAQKKAEDAANKAAELVQQLRDLLAGSAATSALAVLEDDSAAKADEIELLQSVADAAQLEADGFNETKLALSERLPLLHTERTGLVDRLRAVLDELELKTDPADAETLKIMGDQRLYAKAVSGLRVNVADTASAWITVEGWLTSEEGGRRWLLNAAKCLAILIAAWVISRLLSSATRHAVARSPGTSRLLEDFLVKMVRWVVMAIGIIMALAALEISVGPLLAVVGAAGFVVAFALQDSLSNFASGLMILFFQPFDEGDSIDAGGVSGKVQAVNLVSTTILTFDNKRMVVPNNLIWNDVITNITGVTERRVDMTFGIGYDDDIDQAQAILEEIIAAHPKVLDSPESTVRMHELADSSVNFVARPWSKTDDFWDVFWDITKAVKQRFDKEGIGIPFPQRDVHLYIAGNDAEVSSTLRSAISTQSGGGVHEDGGLDDSTDGDGGGSETST